MAFGKIGILKASTASRPTAATVGANSDDQWAGYLYFDTTLVASGKPIWRTGSGTWVDATGTAV